MRQIPLDFDGLVCAEGAPWINPGWRGPHHCAGCAAWVAGMVAAYQAKVASGDYDEKGNKRR